MKYKNSSESRRKLLKSIAAGSGAVIAGKSLPENWTKPVVDSVVLPVHAQTSQFVFSQTLGYDFFTDEVVPPSVNNQIPDLDFTFTVGSAVPAGDGTVTISNLAGDLGDGAVEQWTVQVGATTVGLTNNSPSDCQPAPGSVFPVSQAQLQAALSGGDIIITILNGGDIQTFCGTNTMDITLSFPASN